MRNDKKPQMKNQQFSIVMFDVGKTWKKNYIETPRHVIKPSNLWTEYKKKKRKKKMCGENKSNNWKTSEKKVEHRRKEKNIFWVFS